MNKVDEKHRVVLCTFPDIECARHIGAALVEAQAAACVTLVPNVESIYRWDGKTQHGHEVQAIFKTADYPALEQKLLALHPYEVPEIIALPIVEGLPAYLSWLSKPFSS